MGFFYIVNDSRVLAVSDDFTDENYGTASLQNI